MVYNLRACLYLLVIFFYHFISDQSRTDTHQFSDVFRVGIKTIESPVPTAGISEQYHEMLGIGLGYLLQEQIIIYLKKKKVLISESNMAICSPMAGGSGQGECNLTTVRVNKMFFFPDKCL